jgi:hypothetical protein
MKIVAIVLIQDEFDIWPQVLDQASDFFDKVYVYDTGSVDGSLEFSLADPRAQVINSDPVIFNEFETRRHALEIVSENLQPGDYFYWLDSDEFLGIDRQTFDEKFLCDSPSFIRHRHYNFGFTKEQLEVDPDYFLNFTEFNRTKYEYYCEYAYVELKVLRWQDDMLNTLVGGRSPRHATNHCKYRIPVLHYPYRSVRQMLRRAAARNLAMLQKPEVTWNKHWRRSKLDDMFIDKEAARTFSSATIERDLHAKDGLYDSRWDWKKRTLEAVKDKLKSSSRITQFTHSVAQSVPNRAEVRPKATEYNEKLIEAYSIIDQQMESGSLF